MPNDLRKITLELLRSYELEDRFVNLLLSSPKLKSLSPEELASVTALLYTVVERKITYDYLICAFSKRSISDIDDYVRDVLRIGLCQILDMSSIPDFAAVNETVKLARHKGESGFINAVLRRAVKDKDNLPFPEKKRNFARYISILYSIPLKTVKMLIEIFGEEECEKFIIASSSHSPLSLTINENKISRDDLMAKLADYSPRPSNYTENGIILAKGASPKALAGFSEGEFFVQDESSRIAALALEAAVNSMVIDVCAAPGGKTLSAAIRAREGMVYSFDIHESKLSLIAESAARLGLSNITAAVNDATEPRAELFGKADRVICDVPCSGLGVFSKKPDLRYKDIDSISALPPLQYEILEKSSSYLKDGGILVYSTCTVNPKENEEITDRFILEHPEFSYEVISVGIENSGRITLLPHKHNTDGFYIAKLRKNK